jgi:hypothetical protein
MTSSLTPISPATPPLARDFVALAYALLAAWLPALRLPVDDQHQAWRWLSEADLLTDAMVHACSKGYFVGPQLPLAGVS